MKALILAAGQATRLRPLTLETPKCLVDVGGKSILERQLESLTRAGIRDVVICVGPFTEMIESLVRERFPEVRAEFVKNDRWQETNYIYSIWLARDKLDDDVIILHGDLVFEHSLLERMLDSGKGNLTILRQGEPPEKDFKAWVENNLVMKIGVEVLGENAYFCPPIYKLSRGTMQNWLKEIGLFVERGETGVYAENALNNILRKERVETIFFRDEFAMEIDDHQDLAIAREFYQEGENG